MHTILKFAGAALLAASATFASADLDRSIARVDHAQLDGLPADVGVDVVLSEQILARNHAGLLSVSRVCQNVPFHF